MTPEHEYGPWIEHDGKGCPVVGQYVQCVDVTREGVADTFDGIAGLGGGFSWDWQWSQKPIPGLGCYATRIIRYRVRKPRGMATLERLVQDVQETPSPHTASS